MVTLLHRAELEKNRVILVTSATEREVRAGLAAQIALGLTRVGQRTVLVDCDLRQPQLDLAFDLPRAPGIADVFRAEQSTMEVLQQLSVDNLWLLTAGRRDNSSYTALAKGAAGQVFEQLRGIFDFVVVHGSPVLPGADTRLLARHADTVLLSIVRGISRAHDVLAARAVLHALGVRCLEAVIAGGGDVSRDGTRDFAATHSAGP